VFNVGTGVATSVLELYDICRHARHGRRGVHEAARPGELGRSVLDGELGRRTLGFRAEVSLADGDSRDLGVDPLRATTA
jgi:nucleoside-diphosphate-sugar epimerase